MKMQGKKIRHKLQISDDTSGALMGIVTSEADYKTSLLLNRLLSVRLKAVDPVRQQTNEGNECSFSRFEASAEYSETSVTLVSNRSGNCILNRKYPSIDFFLLMRGQKELEQIVANLRKTDEITAVFQLECEIGFEEQLLL